MIGTATPQTGMYRSAAGQTALEAWYDRALARIGVPTQSLTLATDYGSTHVLTAGPQDAPPVVLLHGMNGNAPSLGGLIAALAVANRVYAVDTIGMPGRSAPTRLSRSGDDYAHWLLEVCDQLGLTQAAFVGQSFGGWLILKLGALAPERISRMVLLDSGGLTPFTVAGQALGGLAFLGAILAPNAVLRRALVRPAFFARNATPDRELLNFFALGLREVQLDLDPAGLPPVSDQALARIHAPTLVIYGEHDRFFDAHAAAQRARTALPGLQAAEIIADQGHIPGTEAEALVYGRIAEFVQA